MHFGPVNEPAFYTYIMGNLKDEWDVLFLYIILSLSKSVTKLEGEKIHITGSTITVGDHKLKSGTKSIIDDILI